MLLSEKINQLDKILTQIESNNHNHEHVSDLYMHLNHDLAHITETLSQNIKKIESNLDSKILQSQKEYQEITTAWLQNATQKVKEEIFSKTEDEYKALLESLSKELSKNIDTEVKNAIENIHATLDIDKIIENLKNDSKMLESIASKAAQATLESINKDDIKAEVKERLFNALKDSIDINDIIKAALETKELNEALKQEIQEKTQDLITTNIDKEYIKTQIETILASFKDGSDEQLKEFVTFLESLKEDTNTNVDSIINDFKSLIDNKEIEAQSLIDTLNNEVESSLKVANDKSQEIIKSFDNKLIDLANKAENDLLSMQGNYNEKYSNLIKEFKEFLESNKDTALEDIIKIVANNMLQNETIINNIKDGVIAKGFTYIKETHEEALKEAIITQVKDYFIEYFSSDDRLKNAMLENETYQQFFKDQSYKATKDKLTHACIKEFVIEALREKAKEILKSDFLQQAEAEAQAHLALMQLQTKLESINDCLSKLETHYDIENRLDLLEEKEKVFNEALQNAKDELKKEFKDATLLGDTFKDFVTESINNYDRAQDTQTDGKIKTLQTELLALMQDLQNDIDDLNANTGNNTINLNATIKKLESTINDLSTDNINTKHNIETQNKKLNEMDLRINTNNRNILDLEKEVDSIKNNNNNGTGNNAGNNNQNPTTTNNKYLSWR